MSFAEEKKNVQAFYARLHIEIQAILNGKQLDGKIPLWFKLQYTNIRIFMAIVR